MARDISASILKLPDEILSLILQDAAQFTPPSPYMEKPVFGTAAALPLVCRRFHSLATPYLYTDIYIRCNSTDGGYANDTIIEGARRTRLLHRTFRQNASLWPHCRKLTITTGMFYNGIPASVRESPTSNLLYVAVDFITWLTDTTHLWIYDERLTRAALSHLLELAVENLPSLKDLRLKDTHGAPFVLPQLFGVLSKLEPGACLRTLDLQGISNVGNSRDWERLRAKAGTAPFTELKLSHFVQSLEALEALVRWPGSLEILSFRMPSGSQYSGTSAPSHYSLGALQPVLASQKAALTHIRIQEIYSTGLEGFDVTDFPKLKSLYLSHDLTGTETAFVASLVAPNLHEYHWDMKLEDQQCGETLGSFGRPEEDWLRAFATAAINHKSALRHFYIQFRPETHPYSYEWKEVDDKQYPWDRMDRVGREVLPHGIMISYKTPNITRDKFRAIFEAPSPTVSDTEMHNSLLVVLDAILQ